MPDDDVCAEWPIVAVCVQDGQDPLCGNLARGFTGAVPPQCSEIAGAWSSGSPGAIPSHSIEVRMCYRFTTLINLNLRLPFGWGLSLGDVYLQRTRTFVVDCPPGDVSGC